MSSKVQAICGFTSLIVHQQKTSLQLLPEQNCEKIETKCHHEFEENQNEKAETLEGSIFEGQQKIAALP